MGIFMTKIRKMEYRADSFGSFPASNGLANIINEMTGNPDNRVLVRKIANTIVDMSNVMARLRGFPDKDYSKTLAELYYKNIIVPRVSGIESSHNLIGHPLFSHALSVCKSFYKAKLLRHIWTKKHKKDNLLEQEV